MRPADLVLLVILGAIWGASFLFIRVAAPVLGPVPLMDIRVILAALGLIVYAAARRQDPFRPDRWRSFVVMGTLNNAIPFVTIATAELVLTASLGAILNATSPFFTVMVNAVWERHRPSAAQVFGTIIGFGGVVVLAGLGPLDLTTDVVVAIAISLVGALSYAVSAVYASRAFRGLPPLQVATNQLIASSIVLAPLALATRTNAEPRAEVIASTVALALLGSSIGYLIYFRLIQRAGPTRAITVTLLIPPFGVLFGNVFLAEPVGAGLLLGLVLILVGIALVNGLVGGQRARQAA